MNISTIHPRVWISHPEDIYRHFILDDDLEIATFQKQPRIKRK